MKCRWIGLDYSPRSLNCRLHVRCTASKKAKSKTCCKSCLRHPNCSHNICMLTGSDRMNPVSPGASKQFEFSRIKYIKYNIYIYCGVAPSGLSGAFIWLRYSKPSGLEWFGKDTEGCNAFIYIEGSVATYLRQIDGRRPETL